MICLAGKSNKIALTLESYQKALGEINRGENTKHRPTKDDI